jgi:hypothetical protein
VFLGMELIILQERQEPFIKPGVRPSHKFLKEMGL